MAVCWVHHKLLDQEVLSKRDKVSVFQNFYPGERRKYETNKYKHSRLRERMIMERLKNGAMEPAFNRGGKDSKNRPSPPQNSLVLAFLKLRGEDLKML